MPFKKTDMFHSIASLPTSIPGKYYAANEQDMAGGCLSFLLDNVLYSRELCPQGPTDEPYKLLDRLAEKAPPGSGGLIVTPWLNGERTPVDDTALRAGIYNLSMTTRAGHIVRAFMEGVAMNSRWALRYVERFIGRRMETLNMVGGGAMSDIWCRIFADVTGRTVRRVEAPVQANARGAAMIAAVGLGTISFDDIPGLVQYENVLEPESRNRDLYDGLFSEFLCIYRKNKAMFRRLNRSP